MWSNAAGSDATVVQESVAGSYASWTTLCPPASRNVLVSGE
jgi:hypothetical protein